MVLNFFAFNGGGIVWIDNTITGFIEVVGESCGLLTKNHSWEMLYNDAECILDCVKIYFKNIL